MKGRAAIPRRRVLGALVCSVLTVGGTFMFAAPAGAAVTLTIRGDREQQAWFWSSNRDIRQCSPQLPPPAPPDAYCLTQDLSSSSPISPGHLGVALKSGDSDMRTYLAFDLGDVPDGATIQSATMTLTVSRPAEHTHDQAGAKPPATANEAAAVIEACLVKEPFGAAEAAPPATMDPHDPSKTTPAEPFAIQGGVDCDTKVLGKQGKTWTFDVKAFVTKWLDGSNNGLVLLPKATGSPLDSWTVEFHGAEYVGRIEDPTGSGATQSVTYVTAAEAPRLTVRYDAPPETGPTTEPTTLPSTVPSVEPPAPAPTSEPVPSTTAEPSASPRPQLPVATSKPVTPWYAWLVLPAGLMGFVALSRAVGREVALGGGNRVAAMIRRRRNESSGE